MRRILLSLLLLTACRDADKFKSSVALGGKDVPAAQLNRGHALYRQHCASCHGESGAGDGHRAQGMNPPPTDLRRGVVKFASVEAGGLPTDQDLARTIRKGLAGTPMGPSALDGSEIDAVVQYLKTFSPRWQHESPLRSDRPDPYFATVENRLAMQPQERWVAEGKRIYHVEAKCWTCHPAYETKAYLYETSGRQISSFRADLYDAKPTMSAFGARVIAPDFTRDELKTGASDDALYRVITNGIGGSGMGPGKFTLDEQARWSLVAYVEALTKLKESGQADELRARLEAQLDWQPGQ